MSFTSFSFIVFLSILFILFYLTPGRYRWIVLLVANYIFYAFAGVQYVVVLIYIIAVAYFGALHFANAKRNRNKTVFIGIIVVLIPLVFFKYTGFMVSNLNIILKAMKSSVSLSSMEVALPLGISFYSFSALSYVIDVAQKKYKPYSNPFHLAVGISFFPCLVAGPIERQNKLVPQIVTENDFDYELATYGLKQILWGLFEKMVIADNLAVYVDKVFDDVHSYVGSPLLVASLFFTIQIYCDFAGYSNIAIGIAKLFGVRLSTNFKSPYFSSSFQEFWSRWHISLSSWFRDYVYIPLGGNRRGLARKNLNVLVTMLVSGLWHGAAWTFVFWGVLHGIVQIIENVLKVWGYAKKNQRTIIKCIKVIFVFSICSILWIFFRADSFSDAWYMLSHMFVGVNHVFNYYWGITNSGISIPFQILLAFELIVLFLYDYKSLHTDVINAISEKHVLIRWFIYCIFSLMVVQFAFKGDSIQFVYAGF